jgi:hypothetical protein
MRRFFSLAAIGGLAVSAIAVWPGTRQSSAPELRDVDLSRWACAQREAGNASGAIDVARNRAKNRPWREPPTDLPVWTIDRFATEARRMDAVLGGQRTRSRLSRVQAESLASFERRIASVTGWIVLAYRTGAESTNCNSRELVDWHVELFPRPSDHPPRPGDPTGLITEITPRTEGPLYRAGIRIQRLASFIRFGNNPRLRTVPTGAPARQVRITGYLFWDDQHNGGTDIGPTVRSGGGSVYHNPWRISAWEIHPVLRIEEIK